MRGLAPFGLAACRAFTLSANEAAKVLSFCTNPTNSRSMSALRPDGNRPLIGLKPSSATKAVISPSDFGLLRYSIAVVSAIHRQGQGDI